VSLTADPTTIPQGESTTQILVDARDPAGVEPVITLLTSESGTFDDETATETIFHCDPRAEGLVDVCVKARFEDGEGFEEDTETAAALEYLRRPHVYISTFDVCVAEQCIKVECPENMCPIIEDFYFVTDELLPQANVVVRASDADGRPDELVTTLSAESGSFDDVHASEALYTCSEFGVEDIDLCVTASDGDEDCDQTKCGRVNCNACPFLYSLSIIPSKIPVGQDTAEVQVRAADEDRYPGPFSSTLMASSGSFDDAHAFDTFFRCDRSGFVEVCVEVDDSLCVKSTCDTLTCP
jgi:hypothetical protein